MKAIEVANRIITKHGKNLQLTNLSLNKLVYLAQVEFLKKHDAPLFDDKIEAWDYGPVEPTVYHSFKHHGNGRITEASPTISSTKPTPNEVDEAIDYVVMKFGDLSAFDLVRYTHREGSAWSNRYQRGVNNEISQSDIVKSSDFNSSLDLGPTITAGIQMVTERYPNALRLLEDA